MKFPAFRSVITIIAALATGSVLVACNSSGNAGFPQIASPPPFDYADGEELRSRMHQLAFELQRLDTTLMLESSGGFVTQEQVVDSLENIERIGGLLRDGDMSMRHVFLRDDMENFLLTVRTARMGAEANPPRYYQAGGVSGACLNCHRINS